MIPEDKFLNGVKAILIVMGAIKRETVLDRESWLCYFYDGYTPIKAVKEDMGINVFINWNDVAEEFKNLLS